MPLAELVQSKTKRQPFIKSAAFVLPPARIVEHIISVSEEMQLTNQLLRVTL